MADEKTHPDDEVERFQEPGDKGLGPGLREKLQEREEVEPDEDVFPATARILELLDGDAERLTVEDVNAVLVPLLGASINRLSDAILYCYAVQKGADCPLYGEALGALDETLPEIAAARKLTRFVVEALREEGSLPDFRPPSEDGSPATSEDAEDA